MTCYQLLYLIVVAAYGIRTSNSASTAFPDATPPSLRQEVEDNSRYKTLEANETMLKLLVSDKNGVSRTEVFDMLHSRDDNLDRMVLPPFPDDVQDAEDSKAEVPLTPKDQAELLQGPEDVVFHESDHEWQGSRGAAAFVMVLAVCIIVLLAYASLIVWRRIYLKRNGLKHEQLKNEPNVEETIDM